MTSATIPGLDSAPTKHAALLAWVREVAELTQPDRVVFADGSEQEYQRLCDRLVAAGTFTALAEDPTSYLARSAPSDVARVESRTFICSEREIDAGPTNNWMAPAEMRATMTELYRGCMRGCTTYMVRPRIQPRYNSVMVARISPGAIQLLVGPASISRSEQMNVRDSTRATSDGADRARYEVGSSSSAVKVPAATRWSQRR